MNDELVVIKSLDNMYNGEIGLVHSATKASGFVPGDIIEFISENQKGNEYIVNQKKYHNDKENVFVVVPVDSTERNSIRVKAQYRILSNNEYDRAWTEGSGFYFGDHLNTFKRSFWAEPVQLFKANQLKDGEVGYLHLRTGGGWMCGVIPVMVPIRYENDLVYMNGSPEINPMVHMTNEDCAKAWLVSKLASDARNLNVIYPLI